MGMWMFEVISWKQEWLHWIAAMRIAFISFACKFKSIRTCKPKHHYKGEEADTLLSFILQYISHQRKPSEFVHERVCHVTHWNQPPCWCETLVTTKALPRLHNEDILRDGRCLLPGCQGVLHSRAIRKGGICSGCGRGFNQTFCDTWANYLPLPPISPRPWVVSVLISGLPTHSFSGHKKRVCLKGLRWLKAWMISSPVTFYECCCYTSKWLKTSVFIHATNTF